MKYFIAIISLSAILIFFNSCKKNNDANNSITGTWELAHDQVSIIPVINYPLGNGNIIKFTDSVYEKYTNGNLIKSGHYIIIKDASVTTEVGLVIPAGQFTNRIIFDNDFIATKIFIQVNNNRLTFLSGFFPTDGGSNLSYIRK